VDRPDLEGESPVLLGVPGLKTLNILSLYPGQSSWWFVTEISKIRLQSAKKFFKLCRNEAHVYALFVLALTWTFIL
jgi:hypothetical protein